MIGPNFARPNLTTWIAGEVGRRRRVAARSEGFHFAKSDRNESKHRLRWAGAGGMQRLDPPESNGRTSCGRNLRRLQSGPTDRPMHHAHSTFVRSHRWALLTLAPHLEEAIQFNTIEREPAFGVVWSGVSEKLNCIGASRPRDPGRARTPRTLAAGGTERRVQLEVKRREPCRNN